MVIDEDIEIFFKITGLDWKCFSFDELINGYRLILSIVADRKDEENYLDLGLLSVGVISFSSVLQFCFDIDSYDDDIDLFCTDKVFKVREKPKELYDERDLTIALSFDIIESSVALYRESSEMEFEMEIFYMMLENFYFIEKIYESVYQNDHVFQKGVGAKLS